MPRRKFSCDQERGVSASQTARHMVLGFRWNVGTAPNGQCQIVTFLQADDRFPNRVVWYMGCSNREDAAPLWAGCHSSKMHREKFHG